jgi:hypothetical protein
VRCGRAGWSSLLLPLAERINYFQHEQRPTEPNLGDFNDGPCNNYGQLIPARSDIRYVAAHSWGGLNGSGHFAQAANAVGNFLGPSTGDGVVAGRVQLEVDHDHNHRHTGGNLYGDGECHIRLRNQNDDSSVHRAVVKIFEAQHRR